MTIQSNNSKDYSLYELIPHREPMLLLNRVIELRDNFSCAQVMVEETSPFFVKGKGVPSWIGIEYMGQTAALIAGFQLKQGKVGPHIGLLLGSRKYQAFTPWFRRGSILHIHCNEIAVVGQELATFQCDIYIENKNEYIKNKNSLCATAKLSVFRKSLD
jgi:predicted hotdog family 3-hydroxylacyl-ACP dehydratase